ncbi:serine/threonine-protein kinase [Pseudofrankia sp. BMG5.37]|uniref:serine/threonine-protein kinase n=1 Tax=Pseudofrankia sp. BMG5.37 TaxID=3050035 RepID=UPI0028959957|nr:serine/threonine-protein kinase [Pseudofrankia sp. BMG5.37]MDT3439189.1 serine/threonine-protein kinase [Pseudofrankia sp. BMG5.37]
MTQRTLATSRSGATTVPGEALSPYDPDAVGPYTLVSRLGEGGMGTVYLGWDPDGRAVAVKVIRPDLASDQEFRRRFRREIEAARRVAPFCTAEVLDADPDAFAPYLVTEFIGGLRLDQAVAIGPLSPSTLTGLAVGVATALTAIHHAGLVHRDLKPSNVILSLSGPRVIDFGIAQTLDGGLAKPTDWGFGSAGWMAPEQVNGQPIGPAADVFTWGMLIACAATGRHPFGGETDLEVARRITSAEPDLAGLPEQLDDLVWNALAKDPSSRPTARDLLLCLVQRRPDDQSTDPAIRLLGLTGTPPRLPRTQTRLPRTRTWLPRRPPARRSVLLVGGVLLLALATMLTVAVRHRGQSSALSAAAAPAAAPVSSAQPTPSPSPDSFRDGGLQFTVEGVECGVEQLGPDFLARRANGQFCLVTMTIRNVGESSRQLQNANQYAYDSTGGRHSADYLSRFYLLGETVWQSAGPGASIHGRLVFDIPRGARLNRLQLHGSSTGTGVSIPI